MVAKRGQQFAGDERSDAQHAALLHRRPLRVRTGQDDEPRADFRHAEDLHLLAAHDVGLPRLVVA
jgi:hypothetical protein